MEAALETFVFLLSSLVQLALFCLAIGLFWHFKRMGKPFIAYMFWVILLAYVAVQLDPVAIVALITTPFAPLVLLYLCIYAALFGALFFNPLKPLTFDDDDELQPDAKQEDHPARTVH